MGRMTKKMKKEIGNLNSTVFQLNLTDICRTFYIISVEGISCSNTHGSLYKIDHILTYKICISKCIKTEAFKKGFFLTMME